MFNDKFYWIWMSNILNMRMSLKKELLRKYKSPEAVFENSAVDVKNCISVNNKEISAYIDSKSKESIKAVNKIEKDLCEKNISIIKIKDKIYPSLLKEIYDPPLILYYKGNPEILKISIAVVGSRNASGYGRNAALKLAGSLAQMGICIVSGLATGIDAYAHLGALESGGFTAAVLGCGIDRIYPSSNEALMGKIAKCGVILSEYPPGTIPEKYNFPRRNRIISGLSKGVLIIEASEISGSLITADYALEQGREVFAVPGNIGYKNSAGTNRLIQQGAALVTCAEDIISVFAFDSEFIKGLKCCKNISEEILDSTVTEKVSHNPGRNAKLNYRADNLGIDAEAVIEYKKIVNLLSYEDMFAEEIGINLGIDVRLLLERLFYLEMEGLIKKDETDRYCLISNSR